MSEQSGPITREQVERAIAKPRNIDYRELPLGWRELAPDYVIAAEAADDWDAEHAALTRWRDELAAAEPVRRVARWDAYALAYAAKNADGAVHYYQHADRAKADGYEIEGGPEPKPECCDECGSAPCVNLTEGDAFCEAGTPAHPIDDTAPERLRERREALGWTTAYAGHWVPWFDHTDVERAESGKGIPAFVARYAAALSAEEARLAEEERLACAYRESDGTLVWDDSPPTEPERPAPRFKVGDWVRVIALGAAHHGHTYQIAEIYGSWHRIVTHGALDDAIFVPIALLRAMLAAIDAQQGGAS